MAHEKQKNDSHFHGLGIAPGILEILNTLRYTQPTPIQSQSIPVAIQGKDIIGIAQTGTGKTLAFGIPMIQLLAQSKNRGLVLLPTRELAVQVDKQLQKVGQSIGLRTAILIGGVAIGPQIQALKKNPHIVIATPGRLIDHMQQHTISLKNIGILVLDEADRMLDMGFLPQIKRILETIPKERQTLLFSATLSKEIMTIAQTHMKLPIRIEVAPSGTTAERVTQEIIIVRKEDKTRLLEKILSQYSSSTLVFTRTKHGAKKITRAIRMMGHSAAEIHSNRSFAQRQDALNGFKSGKYRVLVATDIVARGIDVSGIELVLNYDLPSQSEDYVHRIGRTARAGSTGHAISFAMPDQKREVRSIEQLIRQTLPISPLPELPEARPMLQDSHDTDQRRYPQNNRSRGNRNHPPRRPYFRRNK